MNLQNQYMASQDDTKHHEFTRWHLTPQENIVCHEFKKYMQTYKIKAVIRCYEYDITR